MATNQGFKSFIPSTKLDASFLFWWLKCHRAQLELLGNGATFKEVSKAIVERIEIPLPPLDEQKRIAAILDQADELRRKRQRAIDRLNQLGQAIFHDMFGDLLRTQCRKAPLGEVCDVRDGTHDSPKYVDEGFPLLTSKNFSAGCIDYKGANFISRDDFEKINKRSKVDKGDIVMPMIGTIGSPVIVEVEPDFAIKNVALIKFRDSGMNAEFVRQVLDGPLFQKHVSNKGRGGTQKFVSLGDIRAFEIPLPSSEQQSEFEEKMRVVRTERAKLASSFVLMEHLFTALQHRAFRGEL
jgi:type I restriction enzyme S subunit